MGRNAFPFPMLRSTWSRYCYAAARGVEVRAPMLEEIPKRVNGTTGYCAIRVRLQIGRRKRASDDAAYEGITGLSANQEPPVATGADRPEAVDSEPETLSSPQHRNVH
jgi:hypothetical protein